MLLFVQSECDRRFPEAESMNYEIEADWNLLDACNYRCAYCLNDAATLASKMRTFASPDAWRAAFDATQLT